MYRNRASPRRRCVLQQVLDAAIDRSYLTEWYKKEESGWCKTNLAHGHHD